MENRAIHRIGNAVAAFLASQSLVFAGADLPAVGPGGPEGTINRGSGFTAERLSGRQLRLWKSIQAVVFAQDAAGRPLHPKLRRLWHDVEAGGCRVYIEMPDSHRRVASRAGEFSITETGADGRVRSAVIRLYLHTIDRARSRESTRPGGDFDIFDKLGRIERYAVILGHELAHAASALRDPDHARTIVELGRETDEYYRLAGSGPRTGDRLSVLKRITVLSDLVERYAESVDTGLWAELAAGR